MPFYRINCDCASYKWDRRRPPKGRFMRCLLCGRRLGDMQASVIDPKSERVTPGPVQPKGSRRG